MWQLTLFVVDLLPLKLLIFSLVIAYFGTPSLHQIAPFLSKFSRGAYPRTPLARVGLRIVTVYQCTCYVILFLGNKLIIMRKIRNADQIYTYLMKLKFNKCIEPNSNCRQLYYTKYFHFVCKKSSLSCWKKSAPAPTPPIQKNKWSVSN